MFGRLKSAILGAAVVVAALVPLFGDPRQTPVTHAIWGRMLLRALDMTEAVRESAQASQVFGTLSWRDSLSFTADGFASGDGVAVKDEAGVRRVVAGATPGEVVYAVASCKAVTISSECAWRATPRGPPLPRSRPPRGAARTRL